MNAVVDQRVIEPELVLESPASTAPVLAEPRALQVSSPTPFDMLNAAVARGADLQTLEKLMDLQDRWEKKEAEKAYIAAITRFKANPPEIIKRKRVFFESSKGTVDYMHAELADICEAAIKGLAEVGISHRWDILEQTADRLTIGCVLTHVQGHSQVTKLSGPIAPQTSTKNGMQTIGEGTTYLQRYTLLAATGLAAKGMDNDARNTGQQVEYVTREQVADLEALITEVGADRNKFLVYARVAKLEEIEARHFKAACAALRARGQSPNQGAK
jgi:hypothetical protein